MIQKRHRWPVLAALAVVGLAASCVAFLASYADPDRARFERIREGMAAGEVTAVMGREPDREVVAICQPGERTISWRTGAGASVSVRLTNDSVAHKAWAAPPPVWVRLRRWLHL